jgi:hypothetical protein
VFRERAYGRRLVIPLNAGTAAKRGTKLIRAGKTEAEGSTGVGVEEDMIAARWPTTNNKGVENRREGILRD